MPEAKSETKKKAMAEGLRWFMPTSHHVSCRATLAGPDGPDDGAGVRPEVGPPVRCKIAR